LAGTEALGITVATRENDAFRHLPRRDAPPTLLALADDVIVPTCVPGDIILRPQSFRKAVIENGWFAPH
jgi:hypothetical protein